MAKLIILAFALILVWPGATLAELEGEKEWQKYRNNATVLGLVAGETEMKEVLKFFGVGKIIKPRKKHSLAWLCYKNKASNQYLLLATGQKHDMETLYNIELHRKVDESKFEACHTVDPFESVVSTHGGLKLGLNRKQVLDILGSEFDDQQNMLTWRFKYIETLNPPSVYTHPYPNHRGCIESTIVKASDHTGRIRAKFGVGKLIDIEVYYSGEPYEMEHRENCKKK